MAMIPYQAMAITDGAGRRAQGIANEARIHEGAGGKQSDKNEHLNFTKRICWPEQQYSNNTSLLTQSTRKITTLPTVTANDDDA